MCSPPTVVASIAKNSDLRLNHPHAVRGATTTLVLAGPPSPTLHEGHKRPFESSSVERTVSAFHCANFAVSIDVSQFKPEDRGSDDISPKTESEPDNHESTKSDLPPC